MKCFLILSILSLIERKFDQKLVKESPDNEAVIVSVFKYSLDKELPRDLIDSLSNEFRKESFPPLELMPRVLTQL